MARVKLIGITTPVVDDVPNTTALLAYCARVSSTANQGNHETGGKLLRSLVRRKEWSPFEMVSLTMEINTTRDIARQILRHRSFSFQEFSQRYAEVSESMEFREARLQHPIDRQMSVESENEELEDWWKKKQAELSYHAGIVYKHALDLGIAKEVARTVLPEGMTPSRLYMAGTLRSWLHYVDLRATQATQKEHREITTDVANILLAQFPELTDLIVTGAE